MTRAFALNQIFQNQREEERSQTVGTMWPLCQGGLRLKVTESFSKPTSKMVYYFYKTYLLLGKRNQTFPPISHSITAGSFIMNQLKCKSRKPFCTVVKINSRTYQVTVSHWTQGIPEANSLLTLSKSHQPFSSSKMMILSVYPCHVCHSSAL